MNTIINTRSMNPRRWILAGFVATLPTILFWIAVCIAHFLHNPKYIDMFLSTGGTITRVIFIAGFPIISFIIALFSRYAIRHQTEAKNLWHRETSDMRLNQNLINWNVILISITVIDLVKT